VQAEELQQDQEQEDHHRTVGAPEILRVLPQTSAAQGNQVNWKLGSEPKNPGAF
jgi:hypothetical protein